MEVGSQSMNIIQIDPSNRKQVRDFLSLPRRIYRDIPQWVPPLQGDERKRLDVKHYPFYKHSQAAFFLAYEGQAAVGRLAVLDNRPYNEFNHEKAAFFYLFECEQDAEIARQLFEAAFTWARGRGLEQMLGPKGFTALDGMGMLVKGFEHRPALGVPYNPAYYPGLIEAQGFTTHREVASGYLGEENIQFPEHIHELAERIKERRGLRIARFETRSELRRGLNCLKELYDGTIEESSGNAPITQEETDMLINQMIWVADPNLFKIVMKDDKPVGFLMAYPDISEGLQKTKGRIFPFGWITLLRELRRTKWLNLNGAGIIAEYRGAGGTAILYSELFKSVLENPRYRHADLVQVGLDNDRMQRELANFGVRFYKMHRIYARNLI
jgi:GNAT superfamily N-acetyltransferase